MRKVMMAVALALAAGAAQADTSLLVFGTTKHFNPQGRQYNELNAGLGLEWQPADSGWLVGAFAVRDSIYRLGGAVYGGYRVRHQFDSGIHVEATLRLGWLKDAHFNSVAVVPAIGIGYKAVTLEATYLPTIGQMKSPTAVLWARIAF
jgi:hypothetical protein